MWILLAWIPPHPARVRGGRALAHWDLRPSVVSRPNMGTGKQQAANKVRGRNLAKMGEAKDQIGPLV